MEINGKLRNLTLAVPQTHEPMATKFGVGDDVGDTYTCAKFHYDPIRGFCFPPRFAPARTVSGGFWRRCEPHAPIFTIYTSYDVVSRKDVFLGVPKTKFYISTPLPPKKRIITNF